jgi:tetratricopeptide (TPR) repeat protein
MIKNDLQAVKLKQLSEVLTKVLEANNKKAYSESEEIIDTAFKQLLGLNSELANRLPLEDVINFISAYESAEVFKLIILAELIKVQGETHNLKRNTALWLSLWQKSLRVYKKALDMDKETTLEVSGSNLKAIIEAVSEYDMPKECCIDIIFYYESCDSFDRAEDTLFELLEANENNEEILEIGRSFYNRLMEKSEEELEEGNFSLEEVQKGLKQLERLC